VKIKPYRLIDGRLVYSEEIAWDPYFQKDPAYHLAGVQDYVITHSNQSLPRAILSALGLHLNWYEGHTGYLPGNWDVLWSLSIEEVFYLAFPLVCLGLRRTWLMVPALALLALALPHSRAMLAGNEIWQEKAYLPGMAGIAAGVLCFWSATSLKRLLGGTADAPVFAGGKASLTGGAVVFTGTAAAAAVGSGGDLRARSAAVKKDVLTAGAVEPKAGHLTALVDAAARARGIVQTWRRNPNPRFPPGCQQAGANARRAFPFRGS